MAVDDVSQATVEILNEQEQALLADLQAINDGLLTDLHTRANEVPYNPDKIETFDDMSKGWKVAYKDAKGAWGGWKVGSKAGALAGPHSAVVVGVCSGIIVGVVASVLEYTEGVVVPTGYDELIASGKLRDPKFVYGHYLKIDKSQIGLLRREAGVSINTP